MFTVHTILLLLMIMAATNQPPLPTPPPKLSQKQPKQPQSRRRRPVAHPASVLDPRALRAALEDADLYGTVVQPAHISAFYQALHRQHYPETLSQFVQQYHADEQRAADRNHTSKTNHHAAAAVAAAATTNTPTPASSSSSSSSSSSPLSGKRIQPTTTTQLSRQHPLKNSVSIRKNRNKMQLPRAFLDFLQTTQDLVPLTSAVAHRQTSRDGSTTKCAIRLHDGQLVESVLMRYTTSASSSATSSSSSSSNHVATKGGRASLCVSSQCGCAMGCTFCATGTMGLSGNLTTGEILEQIVHADRILAREWEDLKRQADGTRNIPKLDLVRNVVFMGMGEPLDNYNAVLDACRALIDNKRWNLAHGRVTVSTVGIVDKIRQLTRDIPEISLAVSLHAPNQAMRSAIVPSARNFPITDLIDALDAHMMAFLHKNKRSRAANDNPQNGDFVPDEYTEEERQKESTRRRAMVEYVMLEGDTSTIEAAHELGKLCEGRQLVVNLIPYNQTDVKDKLRCPPLERLHEFRNIVSSYGTFCTIRRTMGADIDSACGQLITLRKTKKQNEEMGDIEDVASALRATRNTAAGVVVKSQIRTIETDLPSATAPSDRDNEFWILPLTIATSVAATCFLVTTGLYLRQRRR